MPFTLKARYQSTHSQRIDINRFQSKSTCELCSSDHCSMNPVPATDLQTYPFTHHLTHDQSCPESTYTIMCNPPSSQMVNHPFHESHLC